MHAFGNWISGCFSNFVFVIVLCGFVYMWLWFMEQNRVYYFIFGGFIFRIRKSWLEFLYWIPFIFIFYIYIFFILITLKSDSACWVQDVLFISIIIEMEIPVVCVLIFIKNKKLKQIFCRSSSNCYIWWTSLNWKCWTTW